ncbi:MAG: MoaD/ThiS family protein [Pirellulaceae bacterium]
MSKIKIPTVMRTHTDGKREIELESSDVGGLLAALTQQYPGLRELLLDDGGELLSYVNVFVNDANIRDLDGNATKLDDRDEVFVVPAMAGG